MTLNKNLTKIYDAHTHFNDQWYLEEHITPEMLIKEAEIAGVGYFNNVAFDLASSKLAIEQVRLFPNAFALIGIHPNEVTKHSLRDLEQLKTLALEPKVVGIGEVGLDYFYSEGDLPLQQKWFKLMIELAQETNLPLMMHIRDQVGKFRAYDDVLKILADYPIERKIVHCFSANTIYAQKFLDHGCYLEIGGAVTFKNAKELQAAVKMIPLDRMLVETDAPYLAPHPFRGQMNASKNISLTIDKIAELKEVSRAEVIAATTTNAFKLFLED